MDYGQFSIASMPTVTQVVTPEQAVQVSDVLDGSQHNDGGFADLLAGIQHCAKEKGLSESVQTEALLLDLSTANPVVDLLALLNVSPQIMTVAEPAQPKSDEELQKSEVSAEVEHVGNEQSDMALQMAMAAYVQPGRAPEITIPVLVSVDKLQNVTGATERPAVITASAAQSAAPQAAPVVVQATPTEAIARTEEANKPAPLSVDKLQNVAGVTEQPAVITASAAPTVAPQVAPVVAQTTPTEAIARTGEANKPAPLSVDKLQNVAGTTEQPAVITSSAPSVEPSVEPQTEPVVVQATSPVVKPEAPVRTGEANIPAPLSVDTLQNVVGATEQPAVITSSAPSVEPQDAPVVVQATSPVVKSEAPVRTGEVNKQDPVSVDRLQNVAGASEPTAATNQPVQLAAESLQDVAQKPAAPVVERAVKAVSTPVTEAAAMAQSITPNPVPPSELELEIQLSQPRPITIRGAAASVSQAAAINESHNIRLRFSSDLQTEKVRTGDERSFVTEVASTLQMEASDNASTLGSETSNGSGNNQGESESASDNQLLTQQMRGQSSSEHQKISAATKTAASEPVRQELQEQVVQQVKERLVQHDVKPGNQQITLTLSPDGLGELKMNLNLQGQKLSVEIVTENRSVRDAIVQHTDALKESLARQNITMESFDVTTGGKGSGNQGQNQNAWRELTKQQQQQQLWASSRDYNKTAQTDFQSAQALQQRQQGHSMLDIHY